MENFEIKLRDGLAVSGKVTDTVIFHYKNGLVDFEITDGCYDRNYRLDAENSQKLMIALGIDEKNNSSFYIEKFKEICQRYDIKYQYSSWLS